MICLVYVTLYLDHNIIHAHAYSIAPASEKDFPLQIMLSAAVGVDAIND